MISWLPTANRLSDWSQVHVTVAGIGQSGYSAADALLEYGAQVTVLDEADTQATNETAAVLETLGAKVELGQPASGQLPSQCDLVLASPGWSPASSIFQQARVRSIPIWGDVELAWRLQIPDRVVPWLGVTGTNGKTTVVKMLESMLVAQGLTVSAVGNVGRPILETILDGVSYDCLVVELSSFQLHWTNSLSLHSAVVLNLNPDHLQWYESLAPSPYAAYCADKAKIYNQVVCSCIYNKQDPPTEAMVADADVVEGARAIGFTLGIPEISMLGVVDDTLVDRAFITARHDSAQELASTTDLPSSAPHMIANALAAASLARSFGVQARSVRNGLRTCELGPHRIQTIGQLDGITWVSDSKATNPEAANASLAGFNQVIWIGGGQAKAAQFDDFVRVNAARIKAAILIGVDRDIIAQAFANHASQIPVVSLASPTPEVMQEAVEQATRFAVDGDTVLLAPACASQDIYTDYADRGDWFTRYVKAHLDRPRRTK